MKGQMQGTGEGVLHGPAPGHAEKHFPQAPGHNARQHQRQKPATTAFKQAFGQQAHRGQGDQEDT